MRTFKITNKQNDDDELKRAVHAEDAFYLICTIKDLCADKINHSDLSEKEIIVLEEILEEINETGLMNYYR